MKTLSLRLLTTLGLFCMSSALHAAGGWTDDYDKALAKAKTEKKQVLLDFTGSDWCGWCIKLNQEVFSKPAFKKYAQDNLILVEVDFPRAKQLPKNVQEQNAKLQNEFKIEGYPTIIVLSADGKKVGELGYMEGGPDAFIEALKALPKS